MPGIWKKPSDKARGKAGKWTISWVDEHGKRRKKAAFTDKAKSIELANQLEFEARRVREGIVDPNEKIRRDAGQRAIAEHVEDYKTGLLAKGDDAKHAKHVAGVLTRLLRDAGIGSVTDIAPDRVQEALGRMRVDNATRTVKAPRTVNHALGCLKAFATWLAHNNRIREVPRGLLALKPISEETGRKVVRRALTFPEMARLLATTEAGPDEHFYGPTRSKHHKIAVTGRERAALYRLAMGTGFRANELRSLTPESFALEGDNPTVTIDAEHTKNGKKAVQPIARELAEGLKAFVASKEPGKPALFVPEKTATMLARDLARAGIARQASDKTIVDFHALRHSYITHLIRSGVNPKVVQKLARHSTITLTLDRYTHLEDGDLRDAIEGKGKSASDAG